MIGFIFGVCHGKAAFELPTSGQFQVIILTCTLTVLPGCVRIKHVKSCHKTSPLTDDWIKDYVCISI